jgi:hypothetical protein
VRLSSCRAPLVSFALLILPLPTFEIREGRSLPNIREPAKSPPGRDCAYGNGWLASDVSMREMESACSSPPPAVRPPKCAKFPPGKCASYWRRSIAGAERRSSRGNQRFAARPNCPSGSRREELNVSKCFPVCLRLCCKLFAAQRTGNYRIRLNSVFDFARLHSSLNQHCSFCP